jgi:hypothetical protein
VLSSFEAINYWNRETHTCWCGKTCNKFIFRPFYSENPLKKETHYVRRNFLHEFSLHLFARLAPPFYIPISTTAAHPHPSDITNSLGCLEVMDIPRMTSQSCILPAKTEKKKQGSSRHNHFRRVSSISSPVWYKSRRMPNPGGESRIVIQRWSPPTSGGGQGATEALAHKQNVSFPEPTRPFGRRPHRLCRDSWPTCLSRGWRGRRKFAKFLASHPWVSAWARSARKRPGRALRRMPLSCSLHPNQTHRQGQTYIPPPPPPFAHLLNIREAQGSFGLAGMIPSSLQDQGCVIRAAVAGGLERWGLGFCCISACLYRAFPDQIVEYLQRPGLKRGV